MDRLLPRPDLCVVADGDAGARMVLRQASQRRPGQGEGHGRNVGPRRAILRGRLLRAGVCGPLRRCVLLDRRDLLGGEGQGETYVGKVFKRGIDCLVFFSGTRWKLDSLVLQGSAKTTAHCNRQASLVSLACPVLTGF